MLESGGFGCGGERLDGPVLVEGAGGDQLAEVVGGRVQGVVALADWRRPDPVDLSLKRGRRVGVASNIQGLPPAALDLMSPGGRVVVPLPVGGNGGGQPAGQFRRRTVLNQAVAERVRFGG